jgi:hypothetical protein
MNSLESITTSREVGENEVMLVQTLRYKGFSGSVYHGSAADGEGGMLFGEVSGLGKDGIFYQGSDLSELMSDFRAGIDHYLDFRSRACRGVVGAYPVGRPLPPM